MPLMLGVAVSNMNLLHPFTGFQHLSNKALPTTDTDDYAIAAPVAKLTASPASIDAELT